MALGMQDVAGEDLGRGSQAQAWGQQRPEGQIGRPKANTNGRRSHPSQMQL